MSTPGYGYSVFDLLYIVKVYSAHLSVILPSWQIQLANELVSPS